jgi:hypothetical protein
MPFGPVSAAGRHRRWAAEVFVMSSLVEQRRSRARAGAGAVLWFAWMVLMWIGFFVLLFAGQLPGIWNAATALPVVIQVVAWIGLLPWMLATWVWTGTWAEWLRIAAVLVFALGWTAISIPGVWQRRP